MTKVYYNTMEKRESLTFNLHFYYLLLGVGDLNRYT